MSFNGKWDYTVLAVVVGYALALSAAAFLVQDAPYDPATYTYSLKEIAEQSYAGYGDPGSYATAAFDIYTTGWITAPNTWIFNLWPPGFPALQAALVAVLGADIPIIAALQVVAILLLVGLMTLAYALLRRHTTSIVAFTIPLVPLAHPSIRAFLLQPVGVALGETIAVSLFMIGVVLCLGAVTMRRYWVAAGFAGISLAGAAYIQGRYEPFLLAMFFTGVALLLAARVGFLRLALNGAVSRTAGLTIIVTAATSQLVLLPWRAYHLITAGSPVWSFASNGEYTNAVRTTEDLVASGGGFFARGAGNLVCRIDASTCGDTANAQEHFYHVLLTHPVEWLAGKFSVIGDYWFAMVGAWTEPVLQPMPIDYLLNGTIVVMGLFVLVAPLVSRKLKAMPEWPILIWFGWTIFAAYLVMFTIFHFEVRYFYFAKIAYMFLFVIVAAMWWPRASKNDAAPESTAA